MRGTYPIRRLSVVALLFVATIAAVTAWMPAGATETGGIVTCGQVTGSQFGPPQLYSCTQSTGGAGSIEPYPFFVHGTHTGTIYWSQPSTTQHLTTVIRATTRVVKNGKKSLCPSGSTELKVQGSVRSDTSGVVTVGGPVSVILCQTSETYQVLPNTVMTIG
jgi:hypothetical protein